MKHTPGPWNVGKCSVTGLIKYVDSPGVESIADVTRANASLEERQANACLIAAAPEMLDALEDYKDYLEAHEDTRGTYDRLCALIAKAKGES